MRPGRAPQRKLAVILINYRTADLSLRALEAVLRDPDAIPGTRVALIDNDSGDGSVERLAAAIAENDWGDRVELVANPRNGGFSYGVNTGMRTAVAWSEMPEYFYLLNSDARPDPGAIATLVRFLDDHPEVGIAGSYIFGPDGVTHDTAFTFPSLASQLEESLGLGVVSRLLRRWVVSKPVPQRAERVDWLAGASMLIRAKVVDQVGEFDENYFLYFEETDFCLAARRAGWPTWYVPASRVEHIGSVSTGWKDFSRPRSGFWFEGRRYYFRKNHGLIGLWIANVLWVTGFVLWSIRAFVQRKQSPHPPRMFRDFLRHNFTFRPIGRGAAGVATRSS